MSLFDAIFNSFLHFRLGNTRNPHSLSDFLYAKIHDDGSFDGCNDSYFLKDMPICDSKNMRIFCVSDTHERHSVIKNSPELSCNIFIHAGDIFMTNRMMSVEGARSKLLDFNNWLGDQPATHRLVIPGNHDRIFEILSPEELRSILTNGTILINETIEIDGYTIFGSPISKGRSDNQAYQSQEFREECFSKAKSIGKNVDILISHGPYQQLVDIVQPQFAYIFGHAHGHYGIKPNRLKFSHTKAEGNNTSSESLITICPSIMNTKYMPYNNPIVIDIPLK